MNSKHSLIFFSGGVIVITGLFLFGVIPTSVISESEPNDGDKEQLIVEETITIQTESKPFDQMSCSELNEFIISFEKGWGSAISLYNKKCS